MDITTTNEDSDAPDFWICFDSYREAESVAEILEYLLKSRDFKRMLDIQRVDNG